MNASKTLVLGITILLILSTLSMSMMVDASSGTRQLEVKSPNGVNYVLRMSMNDYSIQLHVHNTGDNTLSGFSILIDGKRLVYRTINLTEYEQRTYEFDGSKGINVLSKKHKVTLFGESKSANFTFERDINETTTETVPRAQIVNVSVVNGTWKGQPSAYVKVELKNPSIRGSGGFLIVHTPETPGHEGEAVVPAESNKTVLIPLVETPRKRVSGEIRLFQGATPGQYKGALDMVEFVGRAGGETTVWNKTYTTIRPPWVENPYEYENQSLERGPSIPLDVSADAVEREIDPGNPSPILLGGLALVGLLLMRKLV